MGSQDSQVWYSTFAFLYRDLMDVDAMVKGLEDQYLTSLFLMIIIRRTKM